MLHCIPGYGRPLYVGLSQARTPPIKTAIRRSGATRAQQNYQKMYETNKKQI
jgi:hypothetical protein